MESKRSDGKQWRGKTKVRQIIFVAKRRRMGQREEPGEKDGDVLLHKWKVGGG